VAVLLSRRFGGLPPESARRFVSGRASRDYRGDVRGHPANRRRGKKEAYLTIPSQCAYVLLEHDRSAAVVYRRSEQGFSREIYAGLKASIPLHEIDIELPLAELYEGVEFVPELDGGLP